MCNSSNGGGGGGEEWDPCAKKQKHQQNKPRQRGLGVAKLEKILREQKDKEENKVAVAEFSSRLLSALPRQYQPPSSSFLCPVLPPVTAQPPMTMMSLSSSTTSAMHVPLTSTSVPFGPSPFTVPVLYGNAGMNSTSGVGVGGGSGVFGEPATAVPGCGCFPSSCESSLHGDPRIESNRMNTAPLVLQREQYPYPSPTMNPSPLSAAWSTSFSAGRNHQIEHPSNQRPYANYNFIRPEEQKMVGTKRPWPFSNDRPLGLHYPTPFPADIQKSYLSPSCGNGSAIMLDPGKTISREVNRSSHFGLTSEKGFTECASSDGNFLTLGPPGSPSPPRQTSKLDFSEVNLLPFQGCMEGHYQRSTPGGSIHQKPLYRFSTEGHMGREETALSLNYLRDDAEEDNIDLDLKL